MKGHMKGTVASVIILLLFHVIAFVIPFSKTSTFWVGYVFALVSFILMFAVGFKTNRANKDMHSRFLGWPLLYIAVVYMAIQLTISLIFMGFSAISVKIAVVVNAVLLCVALLGLIGTSGTMEAVQQIGDTVQKKVFYIKSLGANVDFIKANCADDVTRKALGELSDAIRYSDPMSHDSLFGLEMQIQRECDLLADLVASGQWETTQEEIKNILILIQRRNQQCLILK